MGGLAVLEDETLLRKLADLVCRKEQLAIHTIKFRSENERVQYLRDCQSTHNSIVSILDAARDAKNKFTGDNSRDSIAHEIYSYVVKGVNSALQTIKNYSLRKDYAIKIKDHANALIAALERLETTDVTGAAILSKTAVYYRDAMDNYLQKYQSMHSKIFSRWIKNSGIKLKDLVLKYQRELGFQGTFEKLTVEEEMLVYNKICVASGRGSIIGEWIDTSLSVAGKGLLLLTLVIMVWDIYTSEYRLETATRDAMTVAAGIAGAYVGTVVTAALGTLAGDVAIDATFMACVGFITGVGATFIIAAAAGAVIAWIFSSGGSSIESAPPNIRLDQNYCYVAPLPDGAAMARQIAHDRCMFISQAS